MLQLDNRTPFEATLGLMPDADGIDTLLVVVKATFTLEPELAVADEQQPVRLEDEYWGEPGASSLKYASELHLPKPATDVVLVGSAHAPGRERATQVETRLRVGPLEKTIRVVGDREWKAGLLGASKGSPQPFRSMPLVYERAFGGVYVKNEKKQKVLAQEDNPVGQGFRARSRRSEIKGDLAPNLLDPKKESRPACYGYVAPTWAPRVAFAGTYDEAWEKGRAPYLPEDFDPRFFNAAHPDLVADGFLAGGETVELTHLSPQPRLRFDLPRCEFATRVRLAGAPRPLDCRLETVLFEPDEERMSLLYRASLPCDKQALKVEQVSLAMADLFYAGRSH